MGKAVSGSAEFSKAVSSSSSVSKVEGTIKTYGIDRNHKGSKGGLKESIDPGDLDSILADFNKKSNKGGGVALTLRRYADHPDFIKTKASCGGLTGTEYTIENELIGKLADLVVWGRLTVDQIHSSTGS